MNKYILIMLMGCVSCQVFATPVSDKTDKAKALVLRAADRHGVVIQREFDSIDNFRGFIVRPKQVGATDELVYADRGGRYLVRGTLLDADGTDCSRKDFVKNHLPSLVEDTLIMASKETWIV